MTPIVIESPFASNTWHTEEDHRIYLQDCIRDCIRRGETPYASHQMLTAALNDADEEERRIGMEAGFDMAEQIGRIAVYMDHGVSHGMAQGISRHRARGLQIEYRWLESDFDE